MAGIVSATQPQVQSARDAVFKLYRALQNVSQGPLPPGASLSTAQAAIVDALVDDVVAKIAPLNT